jgi:hypothetical protein
MANLYRIFTGVTCGSVGNVLLWSNNVVDPAPTVGGVYSYGGIYYTVLNSGTTLNTYPSYLGPVDTNINYGSCPVIARPFAYNPTQATIAGTFNIGTLCIGVDVQDYSVGIGGLNWWNGPNESEGWCIGTVVPAQNQSTPKGNIGNVKFWRGSTNIFTDTEFLNVCKKATGQTFASTSAAVTYLSANNYWTSYNSITAAYFVVSNRWSKIRGFNHSNMGKVIANVTPAYKLYQKTKSKHTSFNNYTLLEFNQYGSPPKLTNFPSKPNVQYKYGHHAWLTDVNVVKYGSTYYYQYPYGGTASYGTTVYQNIVAPWIP